MRRLMKFLHTIGAIGMMGGMICLIVLLSFAPQPTQLSEYALLRGAMGGIAHYVLLPSLALTLVGGLLAMALTPAFHNAPWALVKLATGILVFEWGFVGVQGPMQAEAENSAAALAGQFDPASLAESLSAERGSLWILIGIAALNVVLGVWRPRFARLRPSREAEPAVTPA